MYKALVLGGAGFIGSHLCEYLLEKGIDVYCADNLSTGSRKNIIHLLGNPNFTFGQMNISEFPSDTPKAEVDYIFHLASPASPIKYLQAPIETLKVNSIGTLNMLNLALKNNAKFLFASTSEIYGDPLVHPQPESYWGNSNPIGIRSCYDEGKRFSEALVMAYNREYGLDTRIARIFNTYGPRMDINDGRVVPNFISQALKKKPLTIFGDGEQTRSFCYVTDLVEGLYKLMLSEGNTPVNLGNPNEVNINKFASIISDLVGVGLETTPCDLPKDDPKRRKPDIHTAKVRLDWEPTISLEEGLKKTISYFKEKINNDL